MIFYDKLKTENGSVIHSGDVKDGSTISGDDETIYIDLSKIE